MEKRICPKCNEEFYSADNIIIWICPNCGAEIPKEEG